jgi:hypothetical protein
VANTLAADDRSAQLNLPASAHGSGQTIPLTDRLEQI